MFKLSFPALHRPVYALIDCNSFYCSCERLFRPDLRGRPVVTMSNNDGCVIARTPEAKALGIKMGDPFFKIRDFLRENDVAVFSSNYALYGDVSARVQQTIESMVDQLEVYSIDEVFAVLTGMPEPLRDFARAIQARVLKWTGMPVGIGIGHTKTLAKAAQHASKAYREKTGGVVDLRAPHAVEWLLKRMPVGDVWGVGRRLTEQLGAEGITTAWQLAQCDAKSIRRRYSVVLERTVRELQGEPCIEIQENEPDKQVICTSRMFGERITELGPMREALASYMHRATEKMRRQNSMTGMIRVGIRTSFFGDGPKYSQAVNLQPPYPTDDVRLLTKMAVDALPAIWRDGYRYSKAEIMLMDLRKRGQFTGDLFTPAQPAGADRLMGILDKVNGRWGPGTLRSARMPMTPDWAMKRELMSQSYTTSFYQLLKVRAGR
ncbi:DNA polymerase V [Pseudomonas nitritireducens]|uniref:DNA polymerase V n=1 Tax=Pseudomonas nitroreducens TaxID=46680 RepID=A0A7W7KRT3_PSENT|nr:Y-family DNA polymerase [Pseudomonas nitritireducens]MBB4867138.1 DNA polymerase V [Pseudomonas nitritireducens]